MRGHSLRAPAGPSAHPRVVLALALSAMVTALAGGCGSPDPLDAVVLGATLPLSGRDAELGEAIARGYRRAVSEVNDRGGLHLSGSDRSVVVRLDLRDDGADAARAEALIRDIIDDGAHALLSTASGVRSVAQMVVSERAGRPYFINPVDSAGVSTTHARWGFIVDVSGDAPDVRSYETARAALDAMERAGAVDPMTVRLTLER